MAKTQKLVVRFVASKTLVGFLIRFCTMSLWEHVEILSRDGQGWIGSHAGTGVEKRPLDWAKHIIRDRRYALPVSEAAFNAAQNQLKAMIGTKYNYMLILGLLLHVRWIALKSKKRVDCSQLATEVLQAAGLLPLNVLQAYDALVTPETLHFSPLFIGKIMQP